MTPSHLLDGTEFITAYTQTPHAVLLDVRTRGEYDGGHIAGAMLLDCTSRDFVARAEALARSVPYFVYCYSGGRSRAVVALLHSMGIHEVYELKGGVAENPGLLAAL